jgi:hypothetical protein
MPRLERSESKGHSSLRSALSRPPRLQHFSTPADQGRPRAHASPFCVPGNDNATRAVRAQVGCGWVARRSSFSCGRPDRIKRLRTIRHWRIVDHALRRDADLHQDLTPTQARLLGQLVREEFR